jgi:hypothetical protein
MIGYNSKVATSQNASGSKNKKTSLKHSAKISAPKKPQNRYQLTVLDRQSLGFLDLFRLNEIFKTFLAFLNQSSPFSTISNQFYPFLTIFNRDLQPIQAQNQKSKPKHKKPHLEVSTFAEAKSQLKFSLKNRHRKTPKK